MAKLKEPKSSSNTKGPSHICGYPCCGKVVPTYAGTHVVDMMNMDREYSIEYWRYHRPYHLS